MPHPANPPNITDPPTPADVTPGSTEIGKLPPFSDDETKADLIAALDEEIDALSSEVNERSRRREQLMRWREAILSMPSS